MKIINKVIPSQFVPISQWESKMVLTQTDGEKRTTENLKSFQAEKEKQHIKTSMLAY